MIIEQQKKYKSNATTVCNVLLEWITIKVARRVTNKTEAAHLYKPTWMDLIREIITLIVTQYESARLFVLPVAHWLANL